jgi:hypothetical protein
LLYFVSLLYSAEIKTLKKELDAMSKELDEYSKRKRTANEPEPSLRSTSSGRKSPRGTDTRYSAFMTVLSRAYFTEKTKFYKLQEAAVIIIIPRCLTWLN